MSDEVKFSRSIPSGPNKSDATSMSTAQHVQNLIDRSLPMRVQGGPLGPNEEWRAGEDEALLKKTEHVRRPRLNTDGTLRRETLLELIARCGISPAQIRDNDKEWIAQFCWRAGVNNQEQGIGEPRPTKREAAIGKFVCRDPQPGDGVFTI